MDFPLPPVGEGLFEVELVRWLVRPGDAVSRGQGLAEVMSDKASMEVPAPFAGTITALSATPGTKVKVGQVVLSYEPVGELAAAGAKQESGARRQGTGKAQEPVFGPRLPPPASRRSAPGSPGKLQRPPRRGRPASSGLAVGPDARPEARHRPRPRPRQRAGRCILVDDLAPFLRPKGNDAPAPTASKTDTSQFDLGVAGTRVKLVGLRRRIAEHMVEAKHKIPHYSYIDECNFTDLVRLRNQLREPLAAAGVKLTYLAFFVKAAARALKEVPIVNSTYDEAAGEVILHDKYHIGVAVAAPNGLIVPVVKDADKKDVAAIAAEIGALGADAKAGKSKIDDLRGGTFTVTSVGGIGGLISTPIINHPEVGIMGVGKVVKRPVYDAQGNLHPADVVFLSFSFDHRIVDGGVGAAFGNAVLRYLHAPALLLLPEKAHD